MRQGVEGRIQYIQEVLQNILSGKHYIYDRDAWTESEDVIQRNLEKLRKLRRCLSLIKLVEKYWKKSKATVKSRQPSLKILEKIQAKIVRFLHKKDDDKIEGYFSVKKLVKSYQKLLLEKRFDLIGHHLRQKKRNVAQ